MVILVHGSNHSSRCWDPVVDLLDPPAFALDLPGRGRHPAPLDHVHVSDFIESAVKDIKDADATDAILVGHSMAGFSPTCSIRFTRDAHTIGVGRVAHPLSASPGSAVGRAWP